MMHVFTAVAWLVASAWVYKFGETAIGLPKVPNLTRKRYQTSSKSDCFPLVVIVPARNEESAIRSCILSLLRQNCESLHVIAVDDRSTDATGAVMDELAIEAGCDRLEVVHVQELPPGWLGKPHALAIAARRAIEKYDPEYLLFTDGDVVFQPGILRNAIACASELDADHFVVLPTLIAKTAREAGVLSYIQAMSFWAMRPWRISDPRAKRDVVGVGAFNLLRTAAYLQIGGFEATPMEILEDLYLGRRIKWEGLKQSVAIAPGAVKLHWAAGARGIAKGMTKNLFALFRFRPLPLLASAISVLLSSFLPLAFVLFPATRITGAITLAAIAGVYALSTQINGISPGYFVFFPFAAIMVLYAMLRSMVVTLRHKGVTWRGTFYDLQTLRRNMVQPPK